MPKIQAATRTVDENGHRTELFGHCRTADLVENGTVQSTTDADGWHALCKGATILPNGSILRCSCPHHVGEHRCIDCGEIDVELQPMGVRCEDREACAARILAKREADPRHRKWLEIARKAAEATAENERIRPARSDGRTGQRCHHCGEPTKGGSFVMGHDMKMKGMLLRAARAGDERALAEFMARGWFKDARTHKIPDAVLAAADQVQWNSGPWLNARIEDRLAMIDAGREPEQALEEQ